MNGNGKWTTAPIKELYHGLFDGPHEAPKPSDAGLVFFIGIMRRTREDNKWIFDRLHEQKDAIKEDFGGPLDWHRMDNNIRSKVQCCKECDGYNPENWPELTAWLVDHIQRLEKVFSPRLAKIGKDLKVGISQTAEP